MDAEILFKEGSEEYEKENYGESLRKFNIVLKEFPSSVFAKPAYFNSGLSLQKLGKWQEAIEMFEQFLKRNEENDKSRRDALSHEADCYEKLGKWENVIKVLSDAENKSELETGEKISFYARKGKALRMMKKYFEAEKELRKVMDIYKKEVDNPVVEENYFISMAFFETGEIYRELFSSIKFTLPLERMEKDLLDKSNFFMKAQNSYLRAIRIHNVEWSIVAGFKIGELYENYYNDFITAEIPPELTDEEKEVYLDELKKSIKPLLLRAIEVYERNFTLAERTGKGEKWLIEMETRLNKLREFLKTGDMEKQP
jgi:tetratricopeptide (TPR) repeat protein